MRIGEVAERAGVSVRALRYYEEQGLVVADRTLSGHRQYPESAVPRVRFIQFLYAAGLPSRTVSEMLPLMDGDEVTPAMLDRLAVEQERLRTKIDELSIAHEKLGEIIAVGRQFTGHPDVPMNCLADHP